MDANEREMGRGREARAEALRRGGNEVNAEILKS
jgi:hypothetical protein